MLETKLNHEQRKQPKTKIDNGAIQDCGLHPCCEFYNAQTNRTMEHSNSTDDVPERTSGGERNSNFFIIDYFIAQAFDGGKNLRL